MSADEEKSVHGQRAKELFLKGYNCSQAVFLAFDDMYDIDPGLAMRISAPFGGGMGRLREVCGAVSGMLMAAGVIYGSDEPMDTAVKAELYRRVQALAAEYAGMNGSIICRELLGLGKGADSPVPEKRTEEYYRKRPCPRLAAAAAAILEEYIKENPPGYENAAIAACFPKRSYIQQNITSSVQKFL